MIDLSALEALFFYLIISAIVICGAWVLIKTDDPHDNPPYEPDDES